MIAQTLSLKFNLSIARAVILVLIGLPVLQNCLIAQSTPPGFRHFTADQGLPSSEVYEILQDRMGYLWFSTDNGVSRFDGLEFTNFGALQGLEEPVVFNMQEDRQGRVWMQSMSGHLYYHQGDSIHAFPGNAWLDSQNPNQITALDFTVDSTGNVYVSILPIGLAKFPKGATQGQFILPKAIPQTAYVHEGKAVLVRTFELGKQGLVDEWLGRGIRPLCVNTNGTQSCTLLPENISMEYYSTYAFENGEVLFNRSGYLFAFKQGKLLWQKPFLGRVVSAYQSKNKAIYLGLSNREGVRRYTNLPAVYADDYETLLTGYSVSHILEDLEGGYWFSTTESGVFYQPNPNILIYNQSSGLPLESVAAIATIDADRLYIGFDGGGILQMDSRNGEMVALPPNQKRVDDLYYDVARQTLWAAGNGYLHYYQNGHWQMLKDEQRTIEEGKSYGLAARKLHPISANGQVVWASSHAGYFKIAFPNDNAPKAFTDRAMFGKGYFAVRTYDVFTTAAGQTYISNINGLFLLDGNTLKRPPLLHPCFLGRVEALDELLDSTIVLGTKGYGLVFWKGNKITALTEADGLTANMVENLHIDSAGRLWVGTLNGLNRIKWTWHGRPEIKNITTAHGLPSNEITDVKTIGNKVWVATVGGLACLQRQIKHTMLPPAPVVEQIWVNEMSMPFDKNRRDLNMELKSHQRNIRIRYVSLQYANANKVQYRYRLRPTDDWIMASSRSLNFAALSDGEYKLEIQARNADRMWSASAVVYFSIPPFWWQRGWVIALAFIAALAIASAAYYLRTRRIQRDNFLKQQIVELEYSALQAQMNPHFIFNCLNSIQNFILQNEKDEAIEYLNGFARLVRGMLNASVAGRVSLEEEVMLLENYLKLEQLRFNHRFTYTIATAQDLDLREIKIPPLLIQPYVENAVRHGIADKASDGLVNVHLEEIEGLLIVNITDNGKGFANASHPGKVGHKSVGMSITGRRLELLSNLRRQQAVETKEVTDGSGKVLGTQVTIRMKIGS